MLFLLIVVLSTTHALQIPLEVYKNTSRIVIGVSTYINTPNSADALHGQACLNALDYLDKQFYHYSAGVVNISGDLVPVEFKFLDNKSNITLDKANHWDFCYDDEVVAVIGSVNTDNCIPGAVVLSSCPNQKVYVTGCGLPDSVVLNNLGTFSISTNPGSSLAAFFPYFRIARTTKIALLCALHPYPQNLCNGAASKAYDGGLTVVYRSNIDNNFTYGNPANCTATVQEAIKSGARGLFLLAFEQCVIPILQYLKDIKFAFDIIVVSPERDYTPVGQQAIPIELSNYLNIVTKSHSDFKYTDGWVTNYSVFYNEYLGNYSATPGNFAPYYYTAGHVILKALSTMVHSASTCNPDPSVLFTSQDLANSVAKLDYESLVGRVVYDSKRLCQAAEALYQIYNGTSHVTAPPSTQFRELYIAPPWFERTYDPSYSKTEIGFMITISILILISLVLIVVVIALRKISMISASMPSFLIGMLTGSILVYIGVFIWTFHSLTTTICHLRVWLIALGFVLIYGCMLAKTFRVWVLWSSTVSSGTVVITNVQLTLVMICSVIGMSVFLAIYSGAGGVAAVTHVIDDRRAYYNIEECTENVAGQVILYLMFAIGIISVIAGFVFSFLTRKVSFLAFNESKLILFSVYNIFFFGLLSLICLHLEVNPLVSYILRSICILLAAFLTIVIVFGTKLWYVLHDKTGISRKHSSPMNSSAKSKSTATKSSRSKATVAEGDE